MPRRYQKPRPERLSPHERTAIAYATLDVRLPLSTDATKSSPSPVELNQSAPRCGMKKEDCYSGALAARAACGGSSIDVSFLLILVAVTADWFRLVDISNCGKTEKPAKCRLPDKK